MTSLTIVVWLLLSLGAAIPVTGAFLAFLALFNYMDREEKRYIHELAKECVKVSAERTITNNIGRDDPEAVAAYDKKRKEMLAQMFPSVYNETKSKRDYE